MPVTVQQVGRGRPSDGSTQVLGLSAVHGSAPHAAVHLGGASKQLAQDALLDIVQLPDAGRYAGCQLLIDVWVCPQFLCITWHRVSIAS